MDYDEASIEHLLADSEFSRKVEREVSSPVLARNLSQLPTVWAAVRDVLGFSAMDAVSFVYDRICEMKPPLYTDDEHTDDLPRSHLLGWEKGFADGTSLNLRRIGKASEDRFAENWGRDDVPAFAQTDDGLALHLYLAPPDATAIIEAAKAITRATPLSLHATTADADTLQGYPPELRAAVEAFEVVSRDPSASDKPKAALIAWLAEHKPKLSAGARERIAIVANWKPQGGAPKTPG